MNKVLYVVRNTQKQYVRITVPEAFEVWSTLVAGILPPCPQLTIAGVAVKPALDERGNVMIPLQKSSKTGLLVYVVGIDIHRFCRFISRYFIPS